MVENLVRAAHLKQDNSIVFSQQKPSQDLTVFDFDESPLSPISSTGKRRHSHSAAATTKKRTLFTSATSSTSIQHSPKLLSPKSKRRIAKQEKQTEQTPEATPVKAPSLSRKYAEVYANPEQPLQRKNRKARLVSLQRNTDLLAAALEKNDRLERLQVALDAYAVESEWRLDEDGEEVESEEIDDADVSVVLLALFSRSLRATELA